MKLLVTGTAVAIFIAVGASAATNIRTLPRTPTVSSQSPIQMALAKKPVRKPIAKASQPSQGYRCPSADSSGDEKLPPAGAAVVKTLKLTRLSRPTPTSAVVRVDAIAAGPKDAELFYTYFTTGGRTAGDGPRVTWTLDDAESGRSRSRFTIAPAAA
jgi:hypothetical protein